MCNMTTLKDVKTGDILVWRQDHKSVTSDLLIKAIRLITNGDYGHVAVAVRFDPYVFVVEASWPVVKLSLVDPAEEVFHIPTNKEVPQEALDFLIDAVGLSYGVMDDVRTVLGMVSKRDDKWQCAELTREFLRLIGSPVNCPDTPDSVVKGILSQYHKPIFLLKKD